MVSCLPVIPLEILKHQLNDLALENVVTTESGGWNSLLSIGGSNRLKLLNVGLNTQNVIAAVTLGLAFPKVNVSPLSFPPSTKLTPPRSQHRRSDPFPTTAQPSPAQA